MLVQIKCLRFPKKPYLMFKTEEINGQQIYTPVMLPTGVVDPGISDSGLLFMLTVISLLFNMSGFFGENTLKEFQEVVKEFNV